MANMCRMQLCLRGQYVESDPIKWVSCKNTAESGSAFCEEHGFKRWLHGYSPRVMYKTYWEWFDDMMYEQVAYQVRMKPVKRRIPIGQTVCEDEDGTRFFYMNVSSGPYRMARYQSCRMDIYSAVTSSGDIYPEGRPDVNVWSPCICPAEPGLKFCAGHNEVMLDRWHRTTEELHYVDDKGRKYVLLPRGKRVGSAEQSGYSHELLHALDAIN